MCSRLPPALRFIIPPVCSLKVTSMHDRYERMLPRLAEHARRHPRLYRAKVGALAMLGYGLLLGVLALLVGATVFVVVAGWPWRWW
jgi:hypothetical protein